MRTIAILVALAVIAGTAPAAPYSRDYLSTALWLFTAALAALLAACLVAGWRSFELRRLARVANGVPAARRTPAAQPAFRPARSLDIGDPVAAAHAVRVTFSRSRPWQSAPISDGAPPGRIALGELALSAPQPEPAASGSRSSGAASSPISSASAARSESVGVPS